MRAAIISYFDTGRSWGLGDSAFTRVTTSAIPSLGEIGISNPLGQGLVCSVSDAHPTALQSWREEAIRQVARPEMEIGWESKSGLSRAEFGRRLADYCSGHPVARCELTMYAVGTVFVRLEFGPGIDLPYVNGVMTCFEFAAYTVPVAASLLRIASAQILAAVDGEPSALAELTQRQEVPTSRDETGYMESGLFTSFTHLLLALDEGDEPEPLLELVGLDATSRIDFEYHGCLYYGWDDNVIVAKDLAEWRQKPPDQQWEPEGQVARMLLCIQVAHVFLGTLEAFRQLFLSEIEEQVGGYVRNRSGGRSAQDLNRLRTLALAVVNMTDLDLVAASEEDQTYFKHFAVDAQIDKQQRQLQQATETLYNVQVAELQVQESRRQGILNAILLLLTSFTLISVTADSYDFVRDQEAMLADFIDRLVALFGLLLVLTLLLAFALRKTWPRGTPSKRRRARRRGDPRARGRRRRD